MIISPVASKLRGLRETPLRAVDCGFGLCGTWGYFFGAAYAADGDRLLAPTSGIGSLGAGNRINTYKPDTYKGGVAQLGQLASTKPNGCPVYVPSADKFFLGISSSIPNQGLLSSLTRSGSTATATTFSAHGLSTGDSVPISGAEQEEYNGTFQVTVTGDTTFTYEVEGTPDTPATGDIRWRDAQDVAFATVDPHTLEIEYVGGFSPTGGVGGGKAIYITAKDRVWLLGGGGQFTEINPADNTFSVVTDAALSAMSDFCYCPDDGHVYAACFDALKKIDVNSFAVSAVDLSGVSSSLRVHSLTWVPANGVDTASGRVWVSVRDETGLQICYLLFVLPTTNTYYGTNTGTGTDWYSILTFIPTLERIVAQKPVASLATNFVAYQADLTPKGVVNRRLTGDGCYVESVDKAALPLIKEGRWCIEYYTQEELTA